MQRKRCSPWVVAWGPFLAAVWGAGFSGCGRGPYDIVPVHGRVTYEDGSLIPAVRINVTFVPQAEAKDQRTFPRIGRAEVDTKTGEFKVVTTNSYGDGATAGRHKIQIQALNADGTVSPLVPPAYQDVATSLIEEIEVKPGSTDFHFKVKKP